MVHQGEAGETRGLRGHATSRSHPAGILIPREARDLQHDVQAAWWVGRRRRGRAFCRNGLGSRELAVVDDRVDLVPGFSGQGFGDCVEGLELVGQHPRRHGPVTGPVALSAQRGGRVEGDHDRRKARGSGLRELLRPAYDVEAQRVDHGREPATQPPGDDLVEQREGVRRCVEVVPAAADDRAQVVGRDDLRSPVALLRPRRLPGTGRAHEYDEGWVREGWLHRHDGSVARDVAKAVAMLPIPRRSLDM